MGAAPFANFVNREVELGFLVRCLAGRSDTRVVVLKAPPGYGKSCLTNQLRASIERKEAPFCIVEPLVLDTGTSVQVHDGYFMQRCAEALTLEAQHGARPWPSFDSHARQTRWKTAGEGGRGEIVEMILAEETIRRPVLKYFARLFGIGPYAPGALLGSDTEAAVARCARYATSVLAEHKMVLVVREAHLIDLYSLRSLLETVAAQRSLQIIFEYTAESAFAPAHEKLLLRYPFVQLCPVPKMGRSHVEDLLQASVASSASLSQSAYKNWDGNLRAVQWLSSLDALAPADAPLLVPRLATSLTGTLSQLATPKKLLLAILYAHGEPIARPLLAETLSRAAPDAFLANPETSIDHIVSETGLVVESVSGIRLDNETMAQAIAEAPSFRPLVALAERVLRDVYWDEVKDGGLPDSALEHSLRQIFRLSARTGDTVGLLRACSEMDRRVAQASDQRIYVDAVTSALEGVLPLHDREHDELVTWAATLAYETNDPERSATLLARLRTQNVFTLAMRAFALQEIGRHDASLTMAQVIASDAQSADAALVAELIEALVLGCRGDTHTSQTILERLISLPDYRSSPLIGYAYRFFEVVQGFSECLPKLMLSIEWFERCKMPTAKAYSQLPAAIFLARQGRLAEARNMLSQASAALEGQIKDRHLLLNNIAAMELLDRDPDFATCVPLLSEALSYSRDDFSELTISTNLALARMGQGDFDTAAASARQTMSILTDHDFADRDIYWPICFNAAQIFGAAQDFTARQEALAFPLSHGAPVSVNREYWAYRYGESSSPPREYEYLAAKPYHPVYLSHWLMEVEGLRTLT